MPARLPPLKSLIAFEAAARHRSVKRAAEELCLTASAVSKQIQALEEQLGIVLFQRVNRAVLLTEAGARYAGELNRLLKELGDATQEIAVEARRRLHVLVPAGFASHWLLPRLADFTRAHPEIELALSNYSGVDFASNAVPALKQLNCDAVIVLGPGDWETDWDAVMLVRQPYLVPMCAPALLPDGKPFDDPTQLAEQTWLYNSGFRQMWDYWKECAGVPTLQPRRQLSFNDSNAVVEAARKGLGVMMTGGGAGQPPFGGGAELVPAHSFHVLTYRFTYYLLHPPQGRQNPSLMAFRAWLSRHA